MARKQQSPQDEKIHLRHNSERMYTTQLRSIYSDGRVMSVHGEVFLVRRVPMEPVVEAKTLQQKLQSCQSLMNAYRGLADMTPYGIRNRRLAKSRYRETHLLLVNVHEDFRIEARTLDERKYVAEVNREMRSRGTEVNRRALLFMVKLQDKVGNKQGIGAMIDSVLSLAIDGEQQITDYDYDYERVDGVLRAAGLVEPTREELDLANSWWNQGKYPDVLTLEHPDHIHLFSSTQSARVAEERGTRNCDQWMDDWDRSNLGATHRALQFTTMDGFSRMRTPAMSPEAQWIPYLINQGAVAVSVRAKVEPSQVTRMELKNRKREYQADIREKEKKGQYDDLESEDKEFLLSGIEEMYAGGGQPPTLIDCSVIVAFDGVSDDITHETDGGIARIRPMTMRQEAAMSEMMMGSATRSNPTPQDLPCQAIAFSGIQSLSVAGDSHGIVEGISERDRQVVYSDYLAFSSQMVETGPIQVTIGGTGSGKTTKMLARAAQYQALSIRNVIIDPKEDRESSEKNAHAVRNMGGQASVLSDMLSADGIFDPIRNSPKPVDGVFLATSFMSFIHPWGQALATNSMSSLETQLQHALTYGVENGGDCIGQALMIAQRDGQAHQDLVKPIFDNRSNPNFAAMVGVEPGLKPMSVSDGVTYIGLGAATLDLPVPGTAKEDLTQMEKISLSLVRMMMVGAVSSLQGSRLDGGPKGGVVSLDEGWVFLSSAPVFVKRIGRTARSMNVGLEIYTQSIIEALEQDLKGYIPRGMILSIPDSEKEAEAALEMFGIETEGLLGRVLAPATQGTASGRADEGGVTTNYASLSALIGADGELKRSSVGILADIHRRSVAVVNYIPDVVFSG